MCSIIYCPGDLDASLDLTFLLSLFDCLCKPNALTYYVTIISLHVHKSLNSHLPGHASLFYNEKEARKYDSSSRMVGIQREITERAIELLKLPSDRPSFILDVGCGSGLSGQVCIFFIYIFCVAMYYEKVVYIYMFDLRG